MTAKHSFSSSSSVFQECCFFLNSCTNLFVPSGVANYFLCFFLGNTKIKQMLCPVLLSQGFASHSVTCSLAAGM